LLSLQGRKHAGQLLIAMAYFYPLRIYKETHMEKVNTTINPYTEEPIAEYVYLQEKELEGRLSLLDSDSKAWASRSLQERSDFLLALAARLEEGRRELACLLTAEMGKPIQQAEAEVQKSADCCRFMAAHGEDWLRSEDISGQPKAKVRYLPMGAILMVSPWNYPVWQVIRCAAAQWILGNIIVLKHAPNVWGTAKKLAEWVQEVSKEQRILHLLFIQESDVVHCVRHPAVQGVAFTGSQAAGRVIGEMAGRALKKSVLELGGSDAYLVFEDANLDLAAEIVVDSRMNNSGQVCVAAKRLICSANIYEELLDRILVRMGSYLHQDPMLADCRLGPLARKDLCLQLMTQVQQVIAEGGRCVLGGELPKLPSGFFFQPTVLTDVGEDMLPFKEELFGPVLSVSIGKNPEEMLRLANATAFGLSAALFGADSNRLEDLAKHIRVGCMAINQKVSSDFRLPFGGIKQSGYGKELGSMGVKEFALVQSLLA
jgi:succinate-semialdehyde dehydrogenase / glutarate-semialdehyde dehydrogenase